MDLTNSREAAGFFVARTIVATLLYFASPRILSPLYLEMIRNGHAALVTVAGLGVSVLAWLVTLVVFLALRGGFGGVPARVADPDRRSAMISTGGEIGAYLITVPIVTVIGAVLNMVVVYALARQGLRTNLVIFIAISLVSAFLFFLIFVALRSGMTRAASADGAIDLYDGARMGFGRAIATCFRKYAAFSGRASRSEYWFWVLFQFLMLLAAMVVDAWVFRGAANVVSTLVWLGLLLPSLAVTVRRLHDTDMSGWWLFITLVPLIGSIALLIFLCSRGTEGANRFGMGPATASIPEVFA